MGTLVMRRESRNSRASRTSSLHDTQKTNQEVRTPDNLCQHPRAGHAQGVQEQPRHPHILTATAAATKRQSRRHHVCWSFPGSQGTAAPPVHPHCRTHRRQTKS
jgi:hypothetical protein